MRFTPSITLIFLLVFGLRSQDTIYVDNSNLNAEDGKSWETAFTELQDAIDAASLNEHVSQIWITEGTYHPTKAFDLDLNGTIETREKTFLITHPIQIYGGFTSGQNSLLQRDSIKSKTILTAWKEGSIDTSYHVIFVKSDSITKDFILDGLRIESGKANGTGSRNKRGGGIFLLASNGDLGIQISNCSFAQNFSEDNGGAIFSLATNTNMPLILNCSFFNNAASKSGGAIYSWAINKNQPLVTNCVFSNNLAQENGGALFALGLNSNTPTIKNSTLSMNSSSFKGGGIYTFSNQINRLLINNSILWGNSALDGAEIWANRSTSGSQISYSIIASGSVNIQESGSIIDTSIVILNLDPILVAATNNNLRLASNSPAINAGINDSIKIITDLDGNKRIRYGIVDIGAYEGVPCITSYTLYVDINSTTPNAHYDGSTWNAALPDLQEAINISNACGGGKQIWVAKGTYTPLQVIETDIYEIDQSGDGERELSFYINNPVEIYGGFDSGAQILSERDSLGDSTILSGLLLDNSNQEKAYHIVIMRADSIGADYRLDGLIIRDGKADGGINPNGAGLIAVVGNTFSPIISNTTFLNNHAKLHGGGIYARTTNTFNTNISPIFKNSNFINNYAIGEGGGILFNASALNANCLIHPTFYKCNFEDNSSIFNGGGISIYAGGTNVNVIPIIKKSTFINNTANNQGGGIYTFAGSNSSTPAITKIEPIIINSIFSNNTAGQGGGGIHVFSQGAETMVNPTITNSIFFKNSADSHGGALFALSNGGDNAISEASTTITNCSFFDNEAKFDGGGIYILGAGGSNTLVTVNPSITNSVLWNNRSIFRDGTDLFLNREGGKITNCILSSNTSVEGITIYQDTLVMNPLFTNGIAGDLRLQSTSPAINSGINDSIPCDITIELDNNPRIRYGVVDMGAYEFGGCPDVPLSLSPPNNFGMNEALLVPTEKSINADNIILPDQLIQYHGLQGILLNKNFEVKSGAQFEADPSGCNGLR